ncbi:hypothetical protein YTPLAS73_10940 [Nitrosarchaeum sp.]|nr:hypothetical protein YTPLAS73_10940 [Nitrosarchaeum sp.]
MQKHVLGFSILLILSLAFGSSVIFTASSQESYIPSWIRTTAGWWSQGLLSDGEFVKGIQYLATNGIIRVTSSAESLCSDDALCITAKVERIVDGDTIYVEGYKVRLSLTNAPEKNESGFSEATAFTKRLCPVGSVVTVDQDNKQPYDVYGRLLGKVYCDDKILNSELLFNGHANILTQYCGTSEFSSESWAQDFGCATSLNVTAKSSEKTKSTGNCDHSYPDFCIPPLPPDLDCKDISQKRFTVLPPDPHRFDGDKDGIGCES